MLPLLILAVSVAVSFVIIAQAQTEPTDDEIAAKGIAFPIAELGNCGSKSECHDYCNKPANIEACVQFAQAHGLMNKEEAERGLKFQKRLLSGQTPGGCKSAESCKSFCSEPANLETCIKFAEEHGIKHEKEKTEIAVKFAALVKAGETPGGCGSKEECEKYCSGEANRETCIAFGQKLGFMDEKKAELFRKTGGKGPGGCDSEESCRAYCNDPGNQEACFKFAEEHDLLNKEDIQEAKEGFVRLRQGLEQAPPEVAECLKSNLGSNIIEDIQSGNLTPGIGIGERVRSCFEKFGHQGDAREAINQAPAEINSCVRGKLGDVLDKVKSGEVAPTPEMGDAFRICGEKLRLLQGGPSEGQEGGGADISGFLRSAPPGISGCLKERLGDDFERAKLEGMPPGQEVKETLRECFESFRPEAPEPRGDDASDYHKGVRPADLKDIRKFIQHEGTSTSPDLKPGLNRETFEKFRQEGGLPRDFKPPEGLPEQFHEQFQQQYQPPTSPPPTEPAPAPVPEPAPTTEPAPQIQGNIWGSLKVLLNF